MSFLAYLSHFLHVHFNFFFIQPFFLNLYPVSQHLANLCHIIVSYSSKTYGKVCVLMYRYTLHIVRKGLGVEVNRIPIICLPDRLEYKLISSEHSWLLLLVDKLCDVVTAKIFLNELIAWIWHKVLIIIYNIKCIITTKTLSSLFFNMGLYWLFLYRMQRLQQIKLWNKMKA